VGGLKLLALIETPADAGICGAGGGTVVVGSVSGDGFTTGAAFGAPARLVGPWGAACGAPAVESGAAGSGDARSDDAGDVVSRPAVVTGALLRSGAALFEGPGPVMCPVDE
jgi:hypothetical protein